MALLLGLLIGSFGVAVLTGRASETTLIPLAVPLAMLAAIGLPTLARSVTRLIDWFTVAVFSLFGLGGWGWWLAGLTGWPTKQAAQSLRFAAGFPGFGNEQTPTFGSTFGLAVCVGMIASVGWLALVHWRLSRQPPMLWRPVVLAGSGMTLAWFLLMTLWMPIFNWRNTYRDVSLELAAAVKSTAPVDSHACIAERGLDLAQRASFSWFGNLRFDQAAAACGRLLVVDRRGQIQPEPDEAWVLVWEGRRRADRNERFRLYRRAP